MKDMTIGLKNAENKRMLIAENRGGWEGRREVGESGREEEWGAADGFYGCGILFHLISHVSFEQASEQF